MLPLALPTHTCVHATGFTPLPGRLLFHPSLFNSRPATRSVFCSVLTNYGVSVAVPCVPPERLPSDSMLIISISFPLTTSIIQNRVNVFNYFPFLLVFPYLSFFFFFGLSKSSFFLMPFVEKIQHLCSCCFHVW